MAHQVKMLAAKPSDPSLISGTHMVAERTDSHRWSSDLRMCAMANMCLTHALKININIKKLIPRLRAEMMFPGPGLLYQTDAGAW